MRIKTFAVSIFIVLLFLSMGCSEQLEPKQNNDDGVIGSKALVTEGETAPAGDVNDGLVKVNNPIIPAAASPGTFDQAVYDGLGAAEFSYGGLNYDKWYVAAGVATIPAVDHPLWTGTTGVVNENTWRCKACHGWDYRGVDGIYGSDPASKYFSQICGFLMTPNCVSTVTTPQEIWTFLHDGGPANIIVNPADHAFADWLTDDEIYALTKFVVDIRMEAMNGNAPADKIASDPVSPMFKMAMGSQSNGFRLYNLPSEEGGCDVACHGPDGELIDFKAPNGKFVDTYANENPWEVLHKIRFGHPGADPYMPGIAEYDDPQLGFSGGIDVLSYSQAGLTRSRVVGGRLYDNWIIESGADTTQAVPNPLLTLAPDQSEVAAVSPIDGWRCSTCHGFDYEGGKFGFVNNLVELQGVNNWDAGYVFSVLKNGYRALDPANFSLMTVHKYGDFMNDMQLWNLADFAALEIFDTHEIIRAPTGGIRTGPDKAVMERGHHLYNGMVAATFPDGTVLDCVTCHGADGKLAFRVDGTATDIFMMSWTMPWMSLHQTKYGSPRLPGTVDGIMPGLLEATRDDVHPIGNHDAADVLLFTQESILATATAAENVTIESVKQIRINEFNK